MKRATEKYFCEARKTPLKINLQKLSKLSIQADTYIRMRKIKFLS